MKIIVSRTKTADSTSKEEETFVIGDKFFDIRNQKREMNYSQTRFILLNFQPQIRLQVAFSFLIDMTYPSIHAGFGTDMQTKDIGCLKTC